MTNLTVEQITTLITEAVNADHASKLLRKLCVQVVQLSTRPKKFTVSTPNAQVYFFNDQQSGDLNLTVYRDVSLAPQQEPAVQVPATAPAAGHLSATSETTLSVEAQHQLIPNCPSCGAQYADLVHDPVLKTDFIMCSDCDFEGEASQHLSTESVDK